MEIDIMRGKTLVGVDGDIGSDAVIFETNSGERFKMYHEQD